MTVTEKKPVQVYLGRRHQNLLEQLVEKLGLSQAETLRRGLEALARENIPPEEDPAWQLIGFAGGDADLPKDWSVNHDRYMAEVIQDE